MKRKHSVALVAGGGGLIGTHLCRALLEKGFEVICADIRTGNQVVFPQDVRENGRFRYIRHDVVNPFNIHCDAVFNLASRTDVGFAGKHPVQTLKTDIIGCLNTLDVAKSNNAVYVFASSSDVYGISNANSYNETATGNIPASFPKYTAGTGKRAAEGLCESYRSEFGMDVKVARLFNTYGPEMDPDDGRIISKFLSSALQNKDLLVYGSGGQTRSFCWVGDTVDALIRIMECRDRALSPVNIGSSHEITINALAKRADWQPFQNHTREFSCRYAQARNARCHKSAAHSVVDTFDFARRGAAPLYRIYGKQARSQRKGLRPLDVKTIYKIG